MNAVTIEQAWAAVLAPIVAPLLAVPGTNPDLLANDDPCVIVDCQNAEHKAGPYWLATVRIVVDSSVLVEDPLPAHVAAFEALSLYLQDPAGESAGYPEDWTPLNEAFPSEGLTLNGSFFSGAGNNRAGVRWQGAVQVIAGHSRAV